MEYQKHRKASCAVCGKTFPCKDLLSGDVVRESIANQIRMDVPNWSSDSFICLSDIGRYRSQYVHSLLETEKGELTSLEKEVLDSLSEHDLLSRNIGKVETSMKNIASREAEQAAITLTTVIYALYAASYFVGVTAIVAIVMNYVKRDDVAGTFLESHFRWQIRTFWFGVLWGVLGAITFVFVIGWVVLIADGIWVIYRIVKGWLRLNDGKPMYTI